MIAYELEICGAGIYEDKQFFIDASAGFSKKRRHLIE